MGSDTKDEEVGFCSPWSFQAFYGLLRGEGPRPPRQVLDKWFKLHGPYMLSAFTGLNSQITEEAKKQLQEQGSLSDSTLKFVETIAKRLNLDLQTAYDTMTAFLLHDYLGAERSLDVLMASELKTPRLLPEIVQFHRSEQIFALKCLSSLLQSMQAQEESPTDFSKSLEDFIQERIAGKSFVGRLEELLQRIVTGKFYVDKNSLTSEGFLHSLKLQGEIYQCVIWYLHLFECDQISNHLTIISLLQKMEFGRKQPLKRLLIVEHLGVAEELIRYIESLSVLIAIQVLELDSLIYASRSQDRQTDGVENLRWVAPANYDRLEKQMKDIEAREPFGPIYLAWGLLLELRKKISRENDTDEVDHAMKLQKLGSLARELDALNGLKEMLNLSKKRGSAELQHLTASMFYSLLDGFFDFFEAEPTFSAEVIVDVLSETLKYETISEEFWNQSFQRGVALFARDVLYRFPHFYSEGLRLMRALASSSDRSCAAAVVFFQRLPCYCESLDDISADDIQDFGADNDSIFELVRDRHPFVESPESFLIPAGTQGRISSVEKGSSGRSCIQWDYSYNGWQVCLLRLRSAMSSTKPDSTPHLIPTLELIDQLLKKDPGLSEKFVHFLNICLEYISSIDSEAIGMSRTFSLCLSCIATAAKRFPTEIFSRLSSTALLPVFDSSYRKTEDWSKVTVFPGSIGRLILNNAACGEEDHDAAAAFTRLMLNFAEGGISSNDASFAAGVCFLLKEVFSAYFTWNFSDPATKDEIGFHILHLIHFLLRDVRGSRSRCETEGQNLLNACCDELLRGPARGTLLGLISVGPTFLQTFCRSAPSWKEESDTLRAVALSLSILSQLLDSLRGPKGRTDGDILAVICTPVAGHSPLVQISRYLLFRFDSRLPKLSMLILKKLARCLPSTMLSCLGEWANAFIDGFLSRLESPLEEVQAKLYCLEFLGVCAEFQSGLAEKLLVSSGNKAALDCVWDIVSTQEQFPHLLEASYRLIKLFWSQRYRVAVDWLRQRTDFWLVLSRPLLSGEDQFYLKLVGIAVSVIAEELHWRDNSRGEIPEDLAKVLSDQRIFEAERLTLLYRRLKDLTMSSVSEDQKLACLNDFRNFFATISKASRKEGPDAEGRKRWLQLHWMTYADICSSSVERFEADFPLIRCFGQMTALLSRNWKNSTSEPCIVSLCKVMETHRRSCPDFLVPLAIDYLVSFPAILRVNDDASNDQLLDIFKAIAGLMEKIFSLLFNCKLKSDGMTKVIQAAIASLCSLERLCLKVEAEQFIPILRDHALLRSLVAFLEQFTGIADSDKIAFTHASAALFRRLLSGGEKSMSLILASGWCDYCCLEAPKCLPQNLWLEGPGGDSSRRLLREILAFYRSALTLHRHFFVQKVLDFAGSWAEIIWKSMLFGAESGSELTISVAVNGAGFFGELGLYPEEWRSGLPHHLDETEKCIIATSMKLIYTLSRPSHGHNLKREMRLKHQTDGSSASEATVRAMRHKRCIELLRVCLQFLKATWIGREDVGIAEFGIGISSGVGCKLIRSYSLNIGPEDRNMSFGALFLCAQLCVSSLRKVDSSAKSASPSPHRAFPPILGNLDKPILSQIFELSVVLILTQTVEVLNSSLKEAEKVLLKREVSSELGQLLLRCIRYGGGSPSNQRKSPGVSPVTTSCSVFDAEFLNGASAVVRQLTDS